jgi:hypothetical protein
MADNIGVRAERCPASRNGVRHAESRLGGASLPLFEKMPLQQAIAELTSGSHDLDSPNQLNLFDLTGQ